MTPSPFANHDMPYKKVQSCRFIRTLLLQIMINTLYYNIIEFQTKHIKKIDKRMLGNR
jgi:hypothetical protein